MREEGDHSCTRLGLLLHRHLDRHLENHLPENHIRNPFHRISVPFGYTQQRQTPETL